MSTEIGPRVPLPTHNKVTLIGHRMPSTSKQMKLIAHTKGVKEDIDCRIITPKTVRSAHAQSVSDSIQGSPPRHRPLHGSHRMTRPLRPPRNRAPKRANESKLDGSGHPITRKAVNGTRNAPVARFVKNLTSTENGTISRPTGSHESGRESRNRHTLLTAFPNVPDRTAGARYVPAAGPSRPRSDHPHRTPADDRGLTA